ncbi:MAG: hypothetical protein DU481_07890 [Nitrosomonas sp.]|uniref:hypothetical protein n=1 Tax=Nitrosomonas sp. TaxID=42353 RepID=UPI0032ED570F
MTPDDHVKLLGKLIANFQSFELMLRFFLQRLPTARPIGIPCGIDIYSFQVGEDLPENELTSYDSLGELIKKYNKEVSKHDLEQIDETLVYVRDALAHGRISANDINDTLRLLKFSRPKEGRVTVLFNEEMTETWFENQRQRVFIATKLVANAMSVIHSSKIQLINEAP